MTHLSCGLCGDALTWERGNICGECFKLIDPVPPPAPDGWPRCMICGHAVPSGEWCLCPEIPF